MHCGRDGGRGVGRSLHWSGEKALYIACRGDLIIKAKEDCSYEPNYFREDEMKLTSYCSPQKWQFMLKPRKSSQPSLTSPFLQAQPQDYLGGS